MLFSGAVAGYYKVQTNTTGGQNIELLMLKQVPLSIELPLCCQGLRRRGSDKQQESRASN